MPRAINWVITVYFGGPSRCPPLQYDGLRLPVFSDTYRSVYFQAGHIWSINEISLSHSNFRPTRQMLPWRLIVCELSSHIYYSRDSSSCCFIWKFVAMSQRPWSICHGFHCFSDYKNSSKATSNESQWLCRSCCQRPCRYTHMYTAKWSFVNSPAVLHDTSPRTAQRSFVNSPAVLQDTSPPKAKRSLVDK